MQNKYSGEIKVEEIQRVGQKKFIREGWEGRLVLHEKSGQLAASMDHKQLFQGLNPETQRKGYDSIKHPSEDVSELVFKRLYGKENINDMGKIKNESNVKSEIAIPLNKILYGPPGTGKTYYTIDNALKIIEPYFYAEHYNKGDAGRKSIKDKFDELLLQKRIGFVTFHQSFSYEDFVEGIRAETEDGVINYSVQDGVFKELCERATIGNGAGINEALEKLIEYLEGNELRLDTSTGKKFSVSYRGGKTFRVKPASSTSEVDYPASIENIKKLYRGVVDKSVYNLSYVKSILEYLVNTYSLKDYDAEVENKPVVLIIDEINRGNTANIFGELITLIEPSKRSGAAEALEVTLPYSKERFSVPKNLYIIGTMNTADRSLALLDTALRRRFKFEEMVPDAGLVDKVFVQGVDIKKLLETINKRISIIYDREHMIGHSFFLPLKTESTFEKLKEIFSNDILPLLEEYFFEDWAKIGQILGDFSKSSNLKMIVPAISESEVSNLLGDDGDDFRNIQYKRNIEALDNPQAYIAIYQAV